MAHGGDGDADRNHGCAGRGLHPNLFYWRLGLELADMNNEIQKVWEALREVYGVDLTAATLVVLVKDGDTAVRFITSYFPQPETEK